MSKKLCKRVSDGFLDDHSKKYTHLVDNPKHVCMKCGRVANEEESLCRPKKLKGKKDKKEDITKDKKEDKKSPKKSEETFDEKVQRRIVKVSKDSLRKKPSDSEETKDANNPSLEPVQSFEDNMVYDENLPNED